MTTIGVLDYGMGNLRSVTKAIERVGATPRIVAEPSTVDRVEALVVPGVGAFGACMANLRERGLDRALTRHVELGRPTLGVCLGMQVLFEWSEEGDADGLSLLPGKVVRLPAGVKVPHMGWNDVRWTAAHRLTGSVPDGTRFFFVHSYVCAADGDVTIGEAEHGVRFAAVVARGSLIATQFHPEKSGPAGLAVYETFARMVEETAA